MSYLLFLSIWFIRNVVGQLINLIAKNDDGYYFLFEEEEKGFFFHLLQYRAITIKHNISPLRTYDNDTKICKWSCNTQWFEEK